jgi:hypothetical protein
MFKVLYVLIMEIFPANATDNATVCPLIHQDPRISLEPIPTDSLHKTHVSELYIPRYMTTRIISIQG